MLVICACSVGFFMAGLLLGYYFGRKDEKDYQASKPFLEDLVKEYLQGQKIDPTY